MDINRLLVLGGLVLGMFAASAAAVEDDADLGARLKRAEARLAEIETKQSDTWLSQRRVEEVKTLVREVLADADMRASLMEGGTAGHNGENFFLSSEDGSFLLNIGGQIQVRHLLNVNDNDNTNDQDEWERGFEVPRANMKFWGHIADPRIKYKIALGVISNAAGQDAENHVGMQEVVVSYDIMDGMTIWGGETKAPFLREELIGSSHQLSVERSLINEVFTIGTVQGIGVDWFVDKGSSNMWRVRASFNDGIRSGEWDDVNDAGLHKNFSGVDADKEFDNDASDFAITSRVDSRLMGTWEQGDDFTAWSGEETSVIVGGAIHYEAYETGDSNENSEFVTWTTDASVECNGWNLFASATGLHVDLKEDPNGEDHDFYGFVAQGGYHVIPDKLEPFIRWEYLDLSDINAGGADQELQFLTFGFNWYLAKHAAKVTTDMIWSLHAVPSSNDLGFGGDNTLGYLGLLADDNSDDEDQIAWRIQFQLLF